MKATHMHIPTGKGCYVVPAYNWKLTNDMPAGKDNGKLEVKFVGGKRAIVHISELSLI